MATWGIFRVIIILYLFNRLQREKKIANLQGSSGQDFPVQPVVFLFKCIEKMGKKDNPYYSRNIGPKKFRSRYIKKKDEDPDFSAVHSASGNSHQVTTVDTDDYWNPSEPRTSVAGESYYDKHFKLKELLEEIVRMDENPFIALRYLGHFEDLSDKHESQEGQEKKRDSINPGRGKLLLEKDLYRYIKRIRNLEDCYFEDFGSYLKDVIGDPKNIQIINEAVKQHHSEDLKKIIILFSPFWIRRPQTWDSKDSGTIIDHLFVQYKVPAFLYKGWYYSWDRMSYKWLIWFLLFAQGGSLKKAGRLFKWRLTPRFQKFLLEIAENRTPLEACAEAEIRRLGGNEVDVRCILGNHAFLIDPTEYSSHKAHFTFWQNTISWIIKHSQYLSEDNYNWCLQWAMHEYTEAEREGRGFSWKGRTLRNVSQLSNEYYHLTVRENRPNNLSWSSSHFDWEYENDDNTKWTFTELTSSKELMEEGSAMHHCVASYDGRCSSGYSAIFSMRQNGVRIATVEIDSGECVLISASGPYNSKPSEEVRDVIAQWLEIASSLTEENAMRKLSIRAKRKLERLFIKLGIDSINGNDSAGNTPLHLVVEGRDIQSIRLLIKAGADVNKKNHKGITPLALAVRMQLAGVIGLLIDAGADINEKILTINEIRISYLGYAVRVGDLATIKCILSYLDSIREDEFSDCVWYAATKKKTDYLKVIIDQALRLRPLVLEHAMSKMLMKNELKIVNKLYSAGVKPNINFIYNSLIERNALDITKKAIEKTLLGYWFDMKTLHEIVKVDHCSHALLQMYSNTIPKSANNMNKYEEKYEILSHSIGFLNPTLLHFIIADGINIQDEDNNGNNLLHITANGGRYDVINYLFDNYPKTKSLINNKNNMGETPLFLFLSNNFYCSSSDIKQLIRFFELGADIQTIAKNGETLLHLVVSLGNESMLEFLIEKMKTYLNARNKSGDTPLHYAVMYSDIKNIDLLLKAGADPNVRNNSGQIPLDLSQSDEVMELFS